MGLKANIFILVSSVQKLFHYSSGSLYNTYSTTPSSFLIKHICCLSFLLHWSLYKETVL